MTYELAKELKEAGFKVPLHDCWEMGCQNNYGVCYPTLSELIEACGEIVLWKDEKRGWRAGHGGDRKMAYGESYFDDYPNFLTTGSTPEEAVVRLYLELNKK